ncbi:MAG: threonine synthase [Alphaproteobacteria bacterium]
MLYISTRGHKKKLTFSEAVLKSLADDGGLYVPLQLPNFDKKLLKQGHELSLIDFAIELLTPFMADDDIFKEKEADNFLRIALKKSLAIFEYHIEHDWQPIYKNIWSLELFYGDTLSFKDVAMQFLRSLFDYILAKHGKQITILVATSGDTGSAAIHAFHRSPAVRVVVFHPMDKISYFQRKQMTTIDDKHIHNIAIRGSFDDCQEIVKQLLASEDMATRYHFSAVNSINWARILMQMVYHARAAVLLQHKNKKPINIVVPSGNFGNMLAAYYVRKVGFPIEKLLVATNENDVLCRFFSQNKMVIEKVKATHSPSMDIQVASNLERYLYDLFNCDTNLLKEKMSSFKTNGALILSCSEFEQAQKDFSAICISNHHNLQAIKNWFDKTKKCFDPHSAIALAALENYLADNASLTDTTWLCLATADPRKFASVIEQAKLPVPKFDDKLKKMLQLPEKFTVLDNDMSAVKNYFAKHLI